MNDKVVYTKFIVLHVDIDGTDVETVSHMVFKTIFQGL